MRLPSLPLRYFFSAILYGQGKNGLLVQRLFWGAVAGCLATFLIAGSPYLENMELSMLEWRYQIAEQAAVEKLSSEIGLVNFDDNCQFEMGIARFNDLKSQKMLAQVIEHIEQDSPAMVVLDVDLRGAVCPSLIKTFRRYRNVVLALFGSLEGSTDLPASAYLTHAFAFGYDELSYQSDGRVRQLPISYRQVTTDAPGMSSTLLAPVPSLIEAVLDLYRSIHGVGPNSQFLANQKDKPLYFSFNKQNYPAISLLQVFNGKFAPNQFRNRIVIIGNTLTARQDQTGSELRVLPTQSKMAIHADAIATLLSNQQISTFSPGLSKVFILIFGGAICGLAAILGLAPRCFLLAGAAVCLLVLGQVCFQVFHMVIPVASPLAVLIVCFSLGTFINLDTGLRQRNRELAQAREFMQVRAEEERQRIAEDLHDETLPALSAVARMADKLSNELGDNPVPSQMRERLDFSVGEMRRVINDLHPSVLETMGFKAALENLLAILSREGGMQMQFTENGGFDDSRLTKFCKLQLYRIVQEALNNVQKHSGAKYVEISLRARADHLRLSIIDNGKGMSGNLSKGDSHGVLNIKQRAQLIGAKVEWKKPSAYSSGTEVQIELPLT